MNLEGEVTDQISYFNCFSEVIDHSAMAVARVPHHPRRLLLEMQANSTLSPSDTNPRIRSVSYDDNSNNEANFDTNMVIILAALLCALICALGLNSILRCALRCSRRFTVGNEDANAGTVSRLEGARGLKKRALKQIPVAAYTSGLNMKATECLICLGEFLDGEKVRVLPKCNHGFHVRCIDTWLLSHSSCPTCRQSLVEPPRPPPPEAPESGSREADVTVSVAADEIG